MHLRAIHPCVALVGLVAAVGCPSAAAFDAAALRQAAEPGVCQVVVEGPLGLPIAFASGFLMGKGRFVVTDLASVAQPGAAKVTVRFGDGTTAQAVEFGMADTTTSLVALRTDVQKADRPGLPVRAETVGEEGVNAVAVGWQWGESLAATAGRLVPGPAAADLAERTGCDAVPGNPAFLTFLCPRCDLATGAPLLGEDGAVIAVLLQVIGMEKPVAVSASSVRQALLEAGTNLQPLEKLPAAVWPTDFMVHTGRPPTPAAFAAAVRLVKRRSICRQCKGTGTITVRKFVGTRKVYNRIQRIYREELETCPTCNGDGIVFPKDLYRQFGAMAEGATTILSAPGTPENIREAALNNCMGVLDALRQVSGSYRQALLKHAATDLGQGGADCPRGFLTYAQVAETVRLRGDAFTVLVPHDSPTPLIVNADMLSGYYGAEGGPGAAAAARGAWVVTGGTLVGPVSIQGQRLLFVRLFGWAPGPSLAGVAKRQPLVDERPKPTEVAAAKPQPLPKPRAMPPAGFSEPVTWPPPEDEPAPEPRRRPRPPRPVRKEKKPGEPNFFGL